MSAVLLTGLQTLVAVRSQERTVAKALDAHAATVLWHFDQNLAVELSGTAECVFHDALHVTAAGGGVETLRTGVRHPVTPGPELLLDLWFREEQCGDRFLERPGSAFRFGPGTEVIAVGEPRSAAYAGELWRLVNAALLDSTPVRRSDGIAAGVLDGEPTVIFYSNQLVPGGDAVYALPLRSSSVETLMARAAREFRLLPPTVLPDSVRWTAMRLALELPGATLHTTSAPGATVRTSTRDLELVYGGLRGRVEITPLGAAVLGQPPEHGAGVLGVMMLFVLSLLLVLLAYRQLRREQELSRLRGDFVASVSHELRTPLALQQIFLDTIRLGRADSPERLQWAIGNVEREARRLEYLVSNILQFSRSERGQLAILRRPTSLREIVSRCVDAFQPLAAARGVVIEVRSGVSCDPDGASDIELDEGLFIQALGNVLENAVKYGPEGQSISITINRIDSGMELLVDDEGPGVPAHERAMVMNPYQRGRDAQSGTVTGSGIGLSVAREVIALHGGGIALDDAPGGGLRVRITLPAAAGLAVPAGGIEAVTALPGDAARHLTRSALER